MDSPFRISLLARLAPVSVSLLALLSGCVSNANGNGASDDAGTFEPDAGSPSGFDATVPPTDSSAPAVDAPVVSEDAGPPDAGVDAGPAPVTLLVANDRGPEPGVLVVYDDPTGALLGTATTGVTGMVSLALAPNSQVTAVLQGANGMGFVTIQGVQPGDALTAFDNVNVSAGVAVDVAALPDAGSLEISSYTGYAGAVSSASGDVPFEITGGLTYPNEVEGQFPLLVTATDGPEVAYSYALGNVLPTDGGPAEVTVTTPWASDETSPQLSAINVPPYGSLGGNIYFSFSEIAGNVGTENVDYDVNLVDAGGSASFVGHPGFAAGNQTEVSVRNNLDNYDNASYQSLATRTGALDGGPLPAVDLSQLLPQITAATANVDDGGTESRPVISWTAASPLGAADGIVVASSFSVAYDGGTYGSVWWTIIAPPTVTSVTLPELPASLGTPAVNLHEAYSTPTVIAIQASYFAGYSQLRQAGAALQPTYSLLNDQGGPVVPTLPADGTLSLSAITTNGD